MCERQWFAIIGRSTLFKGEANGLCERGLVVFDDKDIMSGSLFNPVVGQFALSEQGIAGDCLAVDVEGIDDRDEHPDFIGLFEFVTAFYRQSADFFWVRQRPD